MLAGFRTAVNMLPGSVARWLIGLKDFHVIKHKLQSEVNGLLQSLGRWRYLEDLAPAVIDRVLTDRNKKYRDDVHKMVSAVFTELGREAFVNLIRSSPVIDLARIESRFLRLLTVRTDFSTTERE